jgi:Tol biopolymer transport system component
VLRQTPAAWENPSFSPDGQRLALDISDGTQRDIFVYESATDRLNQLTFDPSNEVAPVWSPDGKRVTFASDRAAAGIGNLYSMAADGTGGLVRLTESASDQRPGSWDPSGTRLVYEETGADNVSRVMVLETGGSPAAGSKPAAPSVFVEVGKLDLRRIAPSFSPDGRYVVHRGLDGIYVRSFPGPGGQWRITQGTSNAAAGGIFPRWSASGRELLFLTGDQILAAPYSIAGDEFRAGTPAPWSPTSYQLLGLRSAPYAVHPDGKRVAILAQRDPSATATDHLVFVFNFFEDLRRLIPSQ